MSTVIHSDGRSWLLVKGAPEILASLCVQEPDLTAVNNLACPGDEDACICP